MRDRQRHRAALLDHRRGVAGRDPRELVAAVVGVEVGLVVDLGHVQVEDVLAVVLGGRPELDVAAHPARPRERRVERLERHVAGADEVDLLLASASASASAASACPSRCGTTNIASRNVLKRLTDELAEHRRLAHAVHHDQQLVQRLAPTAHHAAHSAGEHGVDATSDTLHQPVGPRAAASAPRAARTPARATGASRSRRRRSG